MNIPRYLIVINPLTGKHGHGYLTKLRQLLDDNATNYDVYFTHKDSITDETYLKNKINQYSDVVSIGGDGTLNMLCNVLAYQQIPLGIIPCGTGNDFAKNIYNRATDVFYVVTGSKIETVDLGHCHDRYFINVLGIGYDAMMVKQTMHNSKMVFRSLFYLWNALKYLPFYKEEKLSLHSDSLVKHEKTFIAAFGNGAYFGSGMKITPEADFKDGLLDCCWIGELSFIRKCICLARSFSGKHLSEKTIDYTRAEEFHVLSENHPIEADGEFLGYTPATIRVAKSALLLKVS